MESNSNFKENSNNIFDIYQKENNLKSNEGDLSKSEQIYGKSYKEEYFSFSEDDKNQIISIFDFIGRKIDEIMNNLKKFKEYSESLKSLSSEEMSNSNKNIVQQKNGNVSCLRIKKAKSLNNNNDAINDISFQINKLETQINSNFKFIKEKIEKIKSYNEKSITEKESVKIINLISLSNQSSKEKI